MKKFTPNSYIFPSQKGKKVIGCFNGGSISSDGGAILLREADRSLNLLASVAKVLPDKRDQSKVEHSVYDMLQQRVFGIALGYEDLNDHTTLRHDDMFKLTVGKEDSLASMSTLSRFENSMGKKVALDIHKILVDQFINSYSEPPEEIILDFDATDDRVHGSQVGRFFHGYYGDYCFLPLYVFCGHHLLTAYLRPANQDQAANAGAVLKLLVQRIRKDWPNTKIIFRADSGFCRQSTLNWCDRNNVGYIVGLAKNNNLRRLLSSLMGTAEERYEATSEKQVLFTTFQYAAGSWKGPKTVIGKAEHSDHGSNPRFIVTNLEGDPQDLYQKIYCARGDMENRIKEQQLGLFADRTSCHEWWPNQFRLLLSALAYTLIVHIRSKALKGTILEKAQVDTIRLKLFKIGTLILRKTRVIYLHFTKHYPLQDVFKSAYEKLVPT